MGTPFIIVVFAIIFVCIAMALVVVGFMRTNSGLGDEEASQASPAPVDAPEPHNTTGPLAPFMPLPHQTQPLSEIYYYDEHIASPQPSAPLAPLDSSTLATEAEAPPPHLPPPTGPLPGYYPNQ